MKLSMIGISLFLLLLLSIQQPCQATITVIKTNETLVDRIAAFGPRIDGETGLRGNLLVPQTGDSFGCKVIDSPSPSISNWIALVERGQCSFLQKVKSMQDSGAMAVIVGDKHFNGWVTMYAPGDTSDIHVPSVFVAQHQYKALLQLFENNHTVPEPILLSGDDLLTWPLLDMLLVVVLSPAVMMLFIYLTWQLRQRQRRMNDIAPTNFVAKLPTYTFKREKIVDIEHTECAICLEDYKEGEHLRTLPCKHEFHKACVDIWLTTRKKFCPICKFDICHKTESSKSNIPPSERTPLLNA